MIKIVLSIISGIYAISVGIGILGLWTMLYLTNQIPELTNRIRSNRFPYNCRNYYGNAIAIKRNISPYWSLLGTLLIYFCNGISSLCRNQFSRLLWTKERVVIRDYVWNNSYCFNYLSNIEYILIVSRISCFGYLNY